MYTCQRVLAPIDFSGHSTHALQVVTEVAKRYEVPVTLLHVWEPELFSVSEDHTLYDLAQLPAIQERLTKELEKARDELVAAGVVEVDIALVKGSPASEIVRYAEQGPYDLIVMGTHGRTGISHALLGSVAERVVRKAPCAVLTIRVPGQHSAQSASDHRAQA